MLRFILKKLSNYLIMSAFGIVAFGTIFLTIQTQHSQYELAIPTDSRLQKIANKKVIYIDNFPVKTGYITSRYGMRKDPFTGKRSMHKGIDIAAKRGTSVYPVGEGKVIFSGRKSGYGITLEIEHSSTVISRYSHLKKILVKKGQMVKKIDIVAQVGNTGRSTGPHLHLEIAFNGKTANPRVYLSREVASK